MFDAEHGEKLPILQLILWSDGKPSSKEDIKAQVIMAMWGEQAPFKFCCPIVKHNSGCYM